LVVGFGFMEHYGDSLLLEIIERNASEMCRCVCGCNIIIKITDLHPRWYKIELYEVGYKMVG